MTATASAPSTAKRAVLYVRISLDRTGEGLGVARQREDCRRLADQRGWPVTKVITDNDVSATSTKVRPGYAELLAMVDRREVDVIVCWAADRLVRKMTDLEDLMEQCRRAGVAIATVSGDLDLGTDAGRLVARILTSVARAEVERKGARQKRANEQAAAAGKPPAGGPRPFGFRDVARADEEGAQRRQRVHEPAEADAIRRAYSTVLHGGTLAGIAREWNAAGLAVGRTRTARGHEGEPSKWSPETVKVVLRNPRNAGLRSLRGEVVGPGAWAAIVDEDTWRAALAEMADRPRSRQRPPNVQHLLSGLALCGTCGAHVHAGARAPGSYHTYRCSEKLGHVARRGDDADLWVSEVVIDRLTRDDAIELLRKDHGYDVPALKERRGVQEKKLLLIAADCDADLITREQMHEMTARARQRIAEIDAQIQDAGRADVLAPIVLSDDPPTAWKDTPTDQKRVIIGELMTVRLHATGRGARKFDPDTIGIGWKRLTDRDTPGTS